jgi:hypothetical protein
VFEDIGPDDIVAVITDNARSCVTAGKLLEILYPHVSWVPCCAHVLDLLLEDICKLPWAATALKRVGKAVMFFKNHHKALAIFRRISTRLTLLKPGATRFATNCIMLARVLRLRDELLRTVLDPEFATWGSQDKYKTKYKYVKSMLISDENWDQWEVLMKLLEPFVHMMRKVDSHKPMMGKVWAMAEALEAKVKEALLPAAREREVLKLVETRRRMLHSDLHCAAFLLDPEYHISTPPSPKVMTGFLNIVQKLLPTEAEQALAIAQLAKYLRREGLFGRDVVWSAASQMPAADWWLLWGSEVPALQTVAVKSLSQPTAQTASERNYSHFNFIHNKLRNKLSADRAEDLVYVYQNTRLQEKLTAVNASQDYEAWAEAEVDSEAEVESGESEAEGEVSASEDGEPYQEQPIGADSDEDDLSLASIAQLRASAAAARAAAVVRAATIAARAATAAQPPQTAPTAGGGAYGGPGPSRR